jgi:7,8-dihydropterin-6-yl-methyl-4-(beta-D-ribofuranosyl)aminobenzene 5'-phosphate synthase
MKRRSFTSTLVIGSGALVAKDQVVASAETSPEPILVKMIYNNTGSNPAYKKEWGLAIWFEEKGRAVLFDTGGNPDTLWKNMETAGSDLSKLTAIIISHKHWDHTRGLDLILEKTAHKPMVYFPASDADEFSSIHPKASINRVTGALSIAGRLSTTGEMEGSLGNDVLYEQSVLLTCNNQVVVFTGCAHPGIVSIVERTRALHPDKEIALLAGGFHLLDCTAEQLQEISVTLERMKVKQIAPSHCTGEKAIGWLRRTWQERFVEFHIGDELNL